MKSTVVIAAVLAAVTFGAVSPHASAAPANTKPTSKPAPVMVTVKEGDSLSSIAGAYKTTWVRIFNANTDIKNPDLINPGDELRIPTGDEQLTERELPVSTQVVSMTPRSNSSSATTVPRVQTTYTGDANSAKAYIYARESGNNPNATNPNGCYGLGQDCNGVLRAQCGADYACQDAYFDGYATRRYGSWEGALNFWQNNGWW